MAPLKQETADGKLGSLEVDSNSLKLKDNNQGGNKEEESSKSSNLPLIIGVTCGAIVLIATIVISVVFHCRRSNPRDTNSDRMPAEGSGSKRERYELKPIDSKDKDIVSVEEKGINNEGME
ncbi:unnamed protein product [Porites lobata]|uniref:Uncharacterized protein n=1 Tax=Porites lobata TaxID=104759 RepID=A0ABN8MTR1_9CNID|nr:unnamed protein product [Porites lobata]